MSKKIFLEVALLKAVQARNAVSIDTVLKQLGQLQASEKTTPPPPAPVAVPKPAIRAGNPVPEPAPAPVLNDKPKTPLTPLSPSTGVAEPLTAAVEPTADLNELWAQLLDGVGRASPFTRTYLVEAHPVSLVKKVFTIGFDPEFADHIGLVDNSKNHALLQTKLKELGHPHCQIKFIQAEQPVGRKSGTVASPAGKAGSTPTASTDPGPAPRLKKDGVSAPTQAKPEPVPFDKDDFKNDPLIQKALEVFKGQIVEVRS
ncbi:MAG: hypothetical protein H7X97_10165 [Opitutaceae bacterium]|nr:hypothetical protein [Verrucomicrobiales bacterium]